MNIFVSINEGLKTVHKNYQILFLLFAFLFFSFFGLFFVLSIPLGVFFVIFGVDLTDILKGGFFEILFSSIKLFKKFLIFALILSLTIVLYLLAVIVTWGYLFSGTLGIMHDFLTKGELFSLSKFNLYGRRYSLRILMLTPISVSLLVLISLFISFISDLSNYFVSLIKPFSHFLSVFLSVFLYLCIMIVGLSLFLIWISLTLFSFFGVVSRDFRTFEALKEAKSIVFSNPNIPLKALLLFVIYLLTGGFILSLGSLFAVIPNLGAVIAALYHIITQFAHLYITTLLVASFFSYYLMVTKPSQVATQNSDISQADSQQAQAHHQEVSPQSPETQSLQGPP